MVFLTTVLKYSYMFVNVYLSISKSTISKVIFDYNESTLVLQNENLLNYSVQVEKSFPLY